MSCGSTFYTPRLFENECHLYGIGPSFVFGGYTEHPDSVVDQICYGDIASAKVRVDGKSKTMSVIENPYLKGLLKPLSLMVPLTSKGRLIYFAEGATCKQVVHLK